MQFTSALIFLPCIVMAAVAPRALPTSFFQPRCTAEQLTSNGRQLRFTGGGAVFNAGTGQNIAWDVPAFSQVASVVNIFIRANSTMQPYKVSQSTLYPTTGFNSTVDSAGWVNFIVPYKGDKSGLPAPPVNENYFYWANFRLNNGTICSARSLQYFGLREFE